MIRRDYIMRVVQEMVQVLARVVFLKSRQENDQALREIDAALNGLAQPGTGSTGEFSVDQWIELCRKHEQAASGLMVTVADLLRERGELFARQNQPEPAQRARVLALGLLLEALLNGETYVTLERVAKVDLLLDETSPGPLSPPVFRRLLGYFAARGRFAKAENVLFDWLDLGDPEAVNQGERFYERLLAQNDATLAHGDLPRAEAEQGLREMRTAAAGIRPRAET